jgi:hypothetical protein
MLQCSHYLIGTTTIGLEHAALTEGRRYDAWIFGHTELGATHQGSRPRTRPTGAQNEDRP